MSRRRLSALVLLLAAWGGDLGAQTAPPAAAPPLTLPQALGLARVNSQQFQSAQTAAELAAQDRVQARAALLPSVNGFGQTIYTEPNGTPSGIFVANDGVRVYNIWGAVHGDVFAPVKWADYRGAAAAEAVARAQADIAARGLVATVVQDYYTLVAAQRKALNAQQGLAEAQRFFDITRQLEQGGEAAHADVVKAQIQLRQRQRDLQDATLARTASRLALSVLVYPELHEDLTVVDDLEAAPPLGPLDEIRTAATTSSPETRAAEAAVRQQSFGLASARGELLPSVSFDYFYGIDANVIATYNDLHQRLLGSMAQAQVTVPLWNWGATQARMRQAQLRLRQARLALSTARRQLLANVITFYREAETAAAQVTSLQDSLNLADESLRLTLLRYQAGEAAALEVIDAQTTLTGARNAYDDGLVRYRVALAALQTLTGTL